MSLQLVFHRIGQWLEIYPETKHYRVRFEGGQGDIYKMEPDHAYQEFVIYTRSG